MSNERVQVLNTGAIVLVHPNSFTAWGSVLADGALAGILRSMTTQILSPR